MANEVSDLENLGIENPSMRKPKEKRGRKVGKASGGFTQSTRLGRLIGRSKGRAKIITLPSMERKR